MSPLEEWIGLEFPNSLPSRLQRVRESFSVFLLVSFVLHGLILMGLWIFKPDLGLSVANEPSTGEPISISTRFITEKELDSKILGVRPSDSSLKEDPKDRAHFLSDQTRRFERQKIVKKSGLLDGGIFRSKPNLASPGALASSPAKVSPVEIPLNSGRLFLPSKKEVSRTLESDSALGKNQNIPAGMPEHLEDQDIAIGGEVLLSTDEYKYASFYQRLSRDLYPIWYGRIESRVDRKELRRKEVAHTRILVFVDNAGDIQKLEPILNSGCKSCDQIATESLLNLGQMKNPPRDRLGPDGLYNFYVNFLITTAGQASWVRVSPEAEPPKFYNPTPPEGHAR